MRIVSSVRAAVEAGVHESFGCSAYRCPASVTQACRVELLGPESAAYTGAGIASDTVARAAVAPASCKNSRRVRDDIDLPFNKKMAQQCSASGVKSLYRAGFLVPLFGHSAHSEKNSAVN